jgi:hypothetical protein
VTLTAADVDLHDSLGAISGGGGGGGGGSEGNAIATARERAERVANARERAELVAAASGSCGVRRTRRSDRTLRAAAGVGGASVPPAASGAAEAAVPGAPCAPGLAGGVTAQGQAWHPGGAKLRLASSMHQKDEEELAKVRVCPSSFLDLTTRKVC